MRLILVVVLALLSVIGLVAAEEPEYVVATIDGQRMRIRDDRTPALYTADYGDCLGESVINVTRFDAAYYRDNMTIIFHLAGETGLLKEDIMMSIGVFAYGESRFDLTFNPCDANIERYKMLNPILDCLLTTSAHVPSKPARRSKLQVSFLSTRTTSLESLN